MYYQTHRPSLPLCETLPLLLPQSTDHQLAHRPSNPTVTTRSTAMAEVVAHQASCSRAIESSNIGFQLLKKCGWKEGTGLGVSEQGRLEPIQTHVKNDKLGLGVEKTKRKAQQINGLASGQIEHVKLHSKKKQKSLSKRLRKLQEEEARMKEREFDRAFFREFWPDNV